MKKTANLSTTSSATSASAPTYSSFRIDLNGKAPRRGSFSDEGFARVIAFKCEAEADKALTTIKASANHYYSNGYRVSLYRLDKIDGSWVRTDIKEADGRKNKPTAKKEAKKAVAPKAASTTPSDLDELRKEIAELKASYAMMAQVIAKLDAKLDGKADKRTTKKQ